MDEPITGLDVPSAEAIFEMLDLLKARGMTVLVSTHDLQMASDKFDRLMLLKRGAGRPWPAGRGGDAPQPAAGLRKPPDGAARP